MKAISLWQPWATLIALGQKTYETRSWGTGYRGPIAIHAAKRKMTAEEIGVLVEIEDFWDIVVEEAECPYGVIVATGNLVDCRRMDSRLIAEAQESIEYDVGNWEPGRYAWRLADIQPLKQPIPARGAQGVWEWAGA